MSMQVTLERDGHDQPWGFRLQGGVDVGLPLSVLRVLVGTPSEAVLKKGDVITRIGGTGTHGLTHQQAVDLFNSAGNQLTVTLKRIGANIGGTPPALPVAATSVVATPALNRPAQSQALESPPVRALPRTTFVLKSDLPPSSLAPTVAADAPDQLSVQNQPYRTTPLVQPSAKAITELGVGSYSHLRLQEEICSGAREPQLVPVTPAQANALKANDYIMKQKVRPPFFRPRSPDPSVSIRSLLRPTPVLRSRSTWRETSTFTAIGRNAFRIGGQMVALKPAKTRVSRVPRFQPKPLLSPNMWRSMLKAAPVKEVKKKPVKKEREPLPEVTLRKEMVIRVATRDIIEEYCDQAVKEGVPGRKCRPKTAKLKTHEGTVGPAVSKEVEVLFLPGKRNVNFTIVIRKFEEYESFFTVGDKSNLPPGPCASFTFTLDYLKNGMKQNGVLERQPSVQTIDVQKTVSITITDD